MSETTSASSAGLSCEQCRELLSDYVDRELSQDERGAVEKHLAECAKCGTESVRLMGLKKLVQHWEGVKSTGEFRQSVVQQMIRESQQFPAPAVTSSSSSAAAQAHSAGSSAERAAIRAEELEDKGIPPVWILLVAGVLAVAAYYAVLFIRGAH